MRCADIAETWGGLRDWLEASGVLVLPALEGGSPIVRLDADVASDRDATPDEVSRSIGRLQAVIERFGVPAVYVGHTAWDPEDEWALEAGKSPTARPDGPTAVTVRVMAGGVVHELPMVAAWYAAMRELATAVNCAYAS
jgi:hypothetical protein